MTIGFSAGTLGDIGAQQVHLESVAGALQLSIALPFSHPTVFLVASLEPGGDLNVWSGEPGSDGLLDIHEAFVPLLDDQGNVVQSIPLSYGAQGEMKLLGQLGLASSKWGNVTWLARGTGAFVDSDGDLYVVKLAGPGLVSVLQDDPDADGKGPISSIILQGTNEAKSSLSVSAKKSLEGDGYVDIGQVVGSGLKQLSAKASDLSGDGVELDGGLGSLVLHDVLNGADVKAGGAPAQKAKLTFHVIEAGTTVELGGTVDLVAAQFGAGQLTAPAAGKLQVKGDSKAGIGALLSADINLTSWDSKGMSLKSLEVKGGGFHGTLTAAGDVGTLKLSGDFGSSIDVAGSLKAFQIKGGDFAGQLNVNGGLGSFQVRGSNGLGGWLRAGSGVQVGGYLAKVQADRHETENEGEEFGIFAADFGSIQIAEHRLEREDLPFEEGDFRVEFLP